jgi:hypothetical protein
LFNFCARFLSSQKRGVGQRCHRFSRRYLSDVTLMPIGITVPSRLKPNRRFFIASRTESRWPKATTTGHGMHGSEQNRIRSPLP